jgi:hypothetical protein
MDLNSDVRISKSVQNMKVAMPMRVEPKLKYCCPVVLVKFRIFYFYF